MSKILSKIDPARLLPSGLVLVALVLGLVNGIFLLLTFFAPQPVEPIESTAAVRQQNVQSAITLLQTQTVSIDLIK